MKSVSVLRIGAHPILKVFLFFGLAFLITWGTGMVVVLSTHSELVNNVQPIVHPIPLPFPLAIFLVIIGGFGPALAAFIISAFDTEGMFTPFEPIPRKRNRLDRRTAACERAHASRSSTGR